MKFLGAFSEREWIGPVQQADEAQPQTADSFHVDAPNRVSTKFTPRDAFIAGVQNGDARFKPALFRQKAVTTTFAYRPPIFTSALKYQNPAGLINFRPCQSSSLSRSPKS
jgi:hypothetical protein